ncbi:hypothetical protein BDW69DRAFT_167086 [Aspergillus filifer]
MSSHIAALRCYLASLLQIVLFTSASRVFNGNGNMNMKYWVSEGCYYSVSWDYIGSVLDVFFLRDIWGEDCWLGFY